jgi:hypothetical protein
MPKVTEVVMVTDRAGKSQAMTAEVSAPQLAIDALERGCLSVEILANAVADLPGRKGVIEVRLIRKDRDGKVRR